MVIEFILENVYTSVVLTNYGRLLAGRRGDLAPAITLESRRIGDELLASIYRQEKRPIDLPFFFKAATEAVLLANVRTILSVLTAGEGRLRVTRNDATVRELKRCYFRGGLGEKGWIQAIETVLSFDALDPYWYEPTATSINFNAAGGGTMPFFPIFPLQLDVSQVLDRKTVANPGAACWPIWVITGPGNTLSLKNITTGRDLVWNGSLSIADTLVIDTSPLKKTIRLNGVNAWNNVPGSDADLWPLIAGNNDVLVTVGDATADTLVQLAFVPRYVSL
jgi:hypothetical protein